jgi:RNA polymerase sigma-70 factor (ECF subfamily)
MSSRSRLSLQDCIERLQAGDRSARDELIRRSCARLRKLVAKMMQKYGRLRRWEETDDVLQSALCRLLRALESVPIDSADQFFSLAAVQIRRELIDLCRHHFGPEGSAANRETGKIVGSPAKSSLPACEPEAADDDQQNLSLWTDFHYLMESLPAGQRSVFDLVWYHGMTQAQAAEILRMSEAKVKRLWVAARMRLFEGLGGRMPK